MLLSTLSLFGIKVKRVSKYSVVKVNFQYCGQSSCIEPAQLSFSQDDLVLTQTVVQSKVDSTKKVATVSGT